VAPSASAPPSDGACLGDDPGSGEGASTERRTQGKARAEILLAFGVDLGVLVGLLAGAAACWTGGLLVVGRHDVPPEKCSAHNL
jgi:hypothetical protein